MSNAKVIHRSSYALELQSDGEAVEVEVDLKPSEVMHYVDYCVERPNDNTLIVAYLVDDLDTRNPLEDYDGSGKIYSAHSDAGRESHEGIQRAMGLNHDWTPNWDSSRNPLTIMLDCYEHGGRHWSIAGSGTQCEFDTSEGAGVWVPDESCLEHIKSSALSKIAGCKVEYRTIGAVGEAGRILNDIGYDDATGVWRGGFKGFVTASLDAAARAGLTVNADTLATAERKLAFECAESALEEYNAWLAGEVYGVVALHYEQHPQSRAWTLVDEDSCWGYVGRGAAEEAMKERASYLRSTLAA